MTTEAKNSLAEITAIVAEAQKEADSWDEHTMPEVYARRILKVIRADEITRLRAVSGVIQDDMAALMEVLGISTHARDASPHEVMVDEVIPGARRLRAERDRFKAIAEENMAEITRLRAENERLKRVAKATDKIAHGQLSPRHGRCQWCLGLDGNHNNGCPTAIARRALRGETKDE